MGKTDDFRATGPVLKALSLFVEMHPEHLSGADVINKKKVLSGTIYPALGRLEMAGWLGSRWEDIDPAIAGRPRKKLYFLTPKGVRNAGALLLEHNITAARPRPGGRIGLVEKGR